MEYTRLRYMSGLKGQGVDLGVLIIVAGMIFLLIVVLSIFDWLSFVASINNKIKLTYEIEDRGTKTLAFFLKKEGVMTVAEEIGNLRAGKEPAEFVGKSAEALKIKVDIGSDKGKIMKKYGNTDNPIETTIALPGLRKGRISIS